MAKDNRSWGDDRIVGALANLGYSISDQTVGNILKRNGIAPAPERKKHTTWREFIRSHLNVLGATDFFTAEVWTAFGLITHYVLVFMHVGKRRVSIAGITTNPDEAWMKQIARNATMEGFGFLNGCRYLIHDRDTKFNDAFDDILRSVDIEPVKFPARSPNLNAHMEQWIGSVKSEALSRIILFGEKSLHRLIKEYVQHFHTERNHQGKDNVILFSSSEDRIGEQKGTIKKRERLGGLLNFYYREAG